MIRFGYFMATYFAALGIGVSSVISLPVKFVWNASASTPVGLYSLQDERALHVGDLVAIMPPAALGKFLVARGYIGAGVPLLKHVAALPGQKVCRHGVAVSIDGIVLANALSDDRRGRSLPVWQGCQHIAHNHIFLMNSAIRDSFDGRYFGALPSRAIIGRAMPIYTDEAGNGHFVWRGLGGSGS
jgi:conjugative transfer signal peptidase TraF